MAALRRESINNPKLEKTGFRVTEKSSFERNLVSLAILHREKQQKDLRSRKDIDCDQGK